MSEELGAVPKKIGLEVPTPEWWAERPKAVVSPEFLRFQVVVAKRIAERNGITVLEALRRYTPCIESIVEDSIPERVNTLSTDELTKDILWQLETRAKESGPSAYHPEGTFRFGCFNFEYGTDDDSVHIHFRNDERDETGPLVAEKMGRRRQELHDMFSLVRRIYPDAKTVRGSSWLYNLESYRRLFPANYTANPVEETSPYIFGRGEQIWGQFSNHKLELKSDDERRTFIEKLYALDTIDDQSYGELFPLKVLKVEGPIKDFYELYGVTRP